MTSDVMSRLLPTGMMSFFSLIKIAEDILCDRYGDVAKSDQPFGALAPPKDIRDAATWVYEAHVTELCDRWEEGGDAAVPTTAELLMQVSKVTLDHPCTPALAAYMEKLFCAAEERRPIDLADLDDAQREHHRVLQREARNEARVFGTAYGDRTIVGRQ